MNAFFTGGNETFEDILRDGPAYRQANFKDKENVQLWSYCLRVLWTLQPPPPKYGDSYQIQDVYDFLPEFANMTPESQAAWPRSDDKEDWDNEWRKLVVYTYNNVFSDILRFLYEVNCKTGHWHTPDRSMRTMEPMTEEFLRQHGAFYSTFKIDYSLPFENGKTTLGIVFPNNVLLAPIFVDDGLTVSVDPMDPEQVPSHFLDWNASVHNGQALFLRKGVKVSISLDLDPDRFPDGSDAVDRKGVAAVFSHANLCRKGHKGWNICCDNEIARDEPEEMECQCCPERVT